MTESERVAKALIDYRDNPPVREVGGIEGRWYELGDVLAIVMSPVIEYTTDDFITRLAELMTEQSAENAKLRELCKQMYPRAKAFGQMAVQFGAIDDMSYDWMTELRELGVEVGNDG